MDNKEIKKCTQCGASLPQHSNICTYCGSVYKLDSNQTEKKVDDAEMQGDIISNLNNIDDLFDMFDVPFIRGKFNHKK